MKLERLEIRNYRSINELSGDSVVVFDGLDCLVGMNNAGKSNILESITYLFGDVDIKECHYHNHDMSLPLDVRGFFKIETGDLEILDEEDREELEGKLLKDNTLDVCRRSDTESDLEIIALYPTEERLSPEYFYKFHENAWGGVGDKDRFEEDMKGEFPELISFLTEGKESNKGEWTDAYDRFVEDPPDGVDFSLLPASPSGRIKKIIKELLPELIFIPAVKEMDEAAKTSSRGEFGALLKKLSAEVQEELDDAIDKAMSVVTRKLNVMPDQKTGEIIDDRHPGVQAIEKRISHYLSETFQDFSITLNFPNPKSAVMFNNAEILVNERNQKPSQTDSVGEGVQRVLIFSLFRTLADLKQDKLQVSTEDAERDEDVSSRPLLILYEEAELFLHPGLQKILLMALNTLTESGEQVIFTTHSPFMIQDDILTTINLVSKDLENGTQVVNVQEILNERSQKKSNRLLQIQNISSYLFAERVVLVEGLSDRIVFKKIAQALNPDWNFDQSGIPILQVGGKGTLPLFKNFLEDLGISAFVVTDIDAVDKTVNKLSSTEDTKKAKAKLLECAQQLAESDDFKTRINKGYVKSLTDGYRWSNTFDHLRHLYTALIDNEEVTKKQLACLEKLLLKAQEDAKKEVLRSDCSEVQELKLPLVKILLEENILLLSGDIEDYYPEGSSTSKVKSALEFTPNDYEKEDLCSCFTRIEETTDVEMFLARVFQS